MTVQAPKAPIVIIVDGPFSGFEGVVTNVDQANNTVEVTVSFFGKKPIRVNLDVRKVRRNDLL